MKYGGLHVLAKAEYPGYPPVQVRENRKHLINWELELAELRPSET